jgi:hypothetical protein
MGGWRALGGPKVPRRAGSAGMAALVDRSTGQGRRRTPPVRSVPVPSAPGGGKDAAGRPISQMTDPDPKPIQQEFADGSRILPASTKRVHHGTPPTQRGFLPPARTEGIPADYAAYAWSEIVDAWYQTYASLRGQPPYDPRVMVQILVYGYARGLRSSRPLAGAWVEARTVRIRITRSPLGRNQPLGSKRRILLIAIAALGLMIGLAAAWQARTTPQNVAIPAPSAAERSGPVGDSSWFDVRAFGARGDGVTSDTAAIQRAIDAAQQAGGGTVFFPCGTYLLRSSDPRIKVTGNDVRLVGNGACSVLKLVGSTSFIGIFVDSPGTGSLTPFAATPQQTSPTVSLTNPAGFRAGEYVLLQDPENHKRAAGGAAAQLDQILAISGHTVTLATPMMYRYNAADAGAGIRPIHLLRGITIRGLTIDGSDVTSKDGDTIGIKTYGTVGAVIADIRGKDVSGSVIQQDYAYRSIVRDLTMTGSGSGGYGAFQSDVATACAYDDLVSINAGLESIAQHQATPEGFGLLFTDVSASTAHNVQSQGSFHGRGIKWATSNYNTGSGFIANGATDQDTGFGLVNAQWNTFDSIQAHGNSGEGLWFDEGSSHNLIDNANVLGNALHAGHADLDFDVTSHDNIVRNAQYHTYFSYGKNNRVFAATAQAASAVLEGSPNGYRTHSRTPVAVDAQRLADTISVQPGERLLLMASATVADDTAGSQVCLELLDVTDQKVLSRQCSTSQAAGASHALALQAAVAPRVKITTPRTYALYWYVNRGMGSIPAGTAPSLLMMPF